MARMSSDDAIADIVNWVARGNPMPDDDDLEEVYGPDFTIVHNNSNDDYGDVDDSEPDEETDYPYDNNKNDESEPDEDDYENNDEQFEPNNDEFEPDEDDASSDGNENDDEDEPYEKRKSEYSKKILTSKRLVNSIDASLEPTNYNFIPLPWKFEPDRTEEEVLLGYLGPKSNPNTQKIFWTSTPPTSVGRQSATNIIKGPCHELRYTQNLTDELSVFESLFDDEIKERIILCTNRKIDSIVKQLKEKKLKKFDSSKNNYWKKPLDKIELRAFIGLIYFRGLQGQNNHTTNSLFQDRLGHPLFAAVMSRNRFQYLLTVLTFDTPEEREFHWGNDRFTAIREVFNRFSRNCMKHVIPSKYMAIDETLYPMRTQVSMKQYNKSKPAKYGLLFRSINDSKFPYTYSTVVYAGKPELGHGPYYLSSVDQYVEQLVKNLKGILPIEGRNISMDRLYSGISIAKWLLSQQITMVGTMQANRIGLPDELKAASTRGEFSRTIHYELSEKKLALSSYTVNTKSKGKKNVLLLSTMRPYPGITKDDKKNKPSIFKFYDFTKGGTDVVDQRIGFYTCKAKSRRWTMTAFFYILDTIRVNSQTIHSMLKGKKVKRDDSVDFGFELVMALTKPHMQRRSSVGLQSSILKKIQLYLPEQQ